MYFYIKKLNLIDDKTLAVTFQDNLNGKVVIEKSWLTGVFKPIKNPEIFKQAYINNGAVSWNIDNYILDLAPDTMYKEIKNNNGIYIIK